MKIVDYKAGAVMQKVIEQTHYTPKVTESAAFRLMVLQRAAEWVNDRSGDLDVEVERISFGKLLSMLHVPPYITFSSDRHRNDDCWMTDDKNDCDVQPKGDSEMVYVVELNARDRDDVWALAVPGLIAMREDMREENGWGEEDLTRAPNAVKSKVT
jgi:hypothetical protein